MDQTVKLPYIHDCYNTNLFVVLEDGGLDSC